MSVNITIKNALKKFGNDIIIPNLSLKINNSEFFTLLGPSGCGKTTLLRMIAGFNSIEGGEFYFNDKKINNYLQENEILEWFFKTMPYFQICPLEKM